MDEIKAAIFPVFIKHTDLGLILQQQVNTLEICKGAFQGYRPGDNQNCAMSYNFVADLFKD